MILKRIKVDVGDIVGTNCYIIEDEKTKETMVIDPGGETDKIVEMLKTLNANLKYIVLTHCHADHISGVKELKEKCGGQVLIHIKDEPGLHDNSISLTYYINSPEVFIEADSRLNDMDLLHLGELELQVIHTPGHTCGGISLYCKKEQMIFSGDTLFRGSWGRTDLPTSSFEDIINSITKKLMILPDETIVYPGHRKINDDKRRKTNLFRIKTKRILKKEGI